MKNFLNNKRLVFPLVIILVVIVIAIVVFILIGKGANSSDKVSTIKLGNSTGNNATTNVTNASDENTMDNTANNTSNTSNSTSGDDFEFSGDQFYVDAVESFMAGLMDEDDMQKFVDDHVDVKAYLAAYLVNGDDAEFIDEYQGIDDGDSKIDQVGEKFLDLVSSDNDYTLTSISDPKESGDDESITRVTVTLKSDSETKKYRMVFYDDIVIYICDENGDSVIDLND